jgi:ribosomal protein L11 methyltransferase
MPTTWTAVAVTAPAALAEAIESFLLDRGAPGLQTEDTPDGVRVTAHFADAPPLAALDQLFDSLMALHPGGARPQVALANVTDSGWAENWRAHFPPLLIGERLYVHPPWLDAADAPDGRRAIVLDPGMAFGTGHHASTRGCLILLERALRRGGRVLDIGTGSGILAIAAVKLGSGPVWGIEIDPDACAVAAENAAANQVAAGIRFSLDLADAGGLFDVILANLFANQLVDLAPTIAARLPPGGTAIGAGILSAEAGAVHDAWRAAGLRPVGEHPEDGWVALAYERPA